MDHAEQEGTRRQRDSGRFDGGGQAAARSTRTSRSIATWRVGANLLPAPMHEHRQPGGQHADNSVDVQEFMVMPLGFDRLSPSDGCAGGVRSGFTSPRSPAVKTQRSGR